VRATAVVLGAAFGFLISWGQFTDPDRIRDMLLLKDPYLYLMMFTAMAVGTLGARLLTRLRARALVTGELVSFERQRPGRRHVVGAVLFGLGWSISDSCPAPIAGQLAQGVGWSLFTIAGIFGGIELFFRLGERRAAVVRDNRANAPLQPAQR
jgi:uncharacterized protein